MIVEHDANGTDGKDLALMDAILTYEDGTVVRVPALEYEKHKADYAQVVDAQAVEIAALKTQVAALEKKTVEVDTLKTQVSALSAKVTTLEVVKK